MSNAWFFEKFELIADLPDAVSRMRELVLEMAFSGQFSYSTPAKANGLKNWERATVESICTSLSPGFACSKTHQAKNGHVHLRTHNVSTKGTLNFDLLVRIDPKMVDKQKAFLCAGDILFNNTNSQELVGKSCIIDRDYNYGYSNHLTRLRVKEGIDPRFVVFYFTMLRNKGYFSEICTRWINQAAVNTDTLRKQNIPLPPLSEQRRIVAKVEELMGICDRLELEQRERESSQRVLVRSSLQRFSEEASVENLGYLFHRSYTVSPSDLRKTILTLAVQGKLVPQDPKEGSAEELLDALQKKREQNSFDRKARIPKRVPEVCSDEYPYEIPESWCWCRLGNLAMLIDYGTSQKADGQSKNIPVYRMGNIIDGRLVNDNLKYVRPTIDDLPKLYLNNLDLLFNRTNSYELVGKTGTYFGKDNAVTFASYLIRIRLPNDYLDAVFICMAMNAPYFRATQIEPEVVQQCGQANFNGTKLASTVLPIPPLPEQRRIVAKVEELMTMVDELEQMELQKRQRSASLLDAIVHRLSASAG